MITSISIENFKGIGERITIPLRPITLLFGKNSAGKSTILHAMLLVHELLEHLNANPDRTSKGGPELDLGGYRSFVHRGKEEDGVTIRFDLDMGGADWERTFPVDEFLVGDRSADVSDRGFSVETGWVEIRIAMEDGAPVVTSVEIGFDDQWFARLGRWASRNELKSTAQRRVILNEIHPVMCLPGEEREVTTGNLYGFFGESSQSILYRAYFDTDALVGARSDKELLDHFDCDGDVLEAIVLDESSHDPDTIRYARLGQYISETAVVADHEHPAKKELRILRLLFEPAGDGSTDRNLFGIQATSVDEYPVLQSPSVGLPDIRAPIQFDWPISHYNEYIERLETGHAGPQGARFLESMLDRLIRGPLALLKGELDGIRYVGPLRDIPPRAFAPLVTTTADRWAHGMAAWDRLQHDAELCGRVSKAMRDTLALGCGLERTDFYQLTDDALPFRALEMIKNQFDEMTPEHLQALVIDEIRNLPVHTRLLVEDDATQARLTPSDVGVGISQVVPVITAALADANREDIGAILAIEQPELHIHPAAQVGLGDVFIEGMRNTGRLMLIETHSEHLILRLLRRVREGRKTKMPQLTPDELSVIYVKTSEAGVEMTSLNVTSDGDFDMPWPEGFFNERDSELF